MASSSSDKFSAMPRFSFLSSEQAIEMSFTKIYLYPQHLRVDELCQKSGLTRENLEELEVARILVPDTKDG